VLTIDQLPHNPGALNVPKVEAVLISITNYGVNQATIMEQRSGLADFNCLATKPIPSFYLISFPLFYSVQYLILMLCIVESYQPFNFVTISSNSNMLSSIICLKLRKA